MRDAEQARLLTDPAARRMLEPFIGAERTVSQAACEVNCSVQRLMYRVQQFLRSGLLCETRQQSRPGRPLHYYRAVADGFHIPFEVTPFADLEAMIARQHAPFDRLRNRVSARLSQGREHAGRRIYRDALTGELNNESSRPDGDARRDGWTPAPGRAAIANDVTLSVRLTSQQAASFARELAELCGRLQAAQSPESQQATVLGQTFLFHLGMLPLAPGESD